MATPPLGLILPSERTPEQQKAHEDAMGQFRNFAIPFQDYPKGTKVDLTQFWKHPDVVSDIGQPFTGFGQYTGSCVGVSNGNEIITALATQRAIGKSPTKVEIIWWPFPYGCTRFNEGDRGQGEGAVDSIIGDTVVKGGFFNSTQPGLPAFTKTGPDGWWLTRSIELQWSYLPPNSTNQKWYDLGKPQAGTTKTVCNSVEDIRTSIINGYPVLDGCNMYVRNGSIQGSGDEACVIGRYDGNGGHSTCFLGAWNHPTLGWLYLYSNQWDTSTYPKDPAGAGRCCVWLKEATVASLFRMGGDRGETMSYVSVPGQPAQPEILNYVP